MSYPACPDASPGQERGRPAFAFSPAIRRDLSEPVLPSYWPGDDVVDIISCTWYIGSEDQYQGSEVFMKAYFLHRSGKGLPLGIDEIGGCDAQGRHNDFYLQRMFSDLADLGQEGATFSYVTVFLESKWGTDANLAWLQ